MGIRDSARKRRETGLLRKAGVTRPVALIDAANTKGADIAAAAALPLATATGQSVTVTGGVTITSIPEAPAGVIRRVIYDDYGTIAHNATSLILPGFANIERRPGDTAEYTSLGDGNWKCNYHNRADGTPVTSLRYHTTSTTSISFTAGDEGQSRTLTTADQNLSYVAGDLVRVTSPGGSAIFFEATVTSYEVDQLVVEIVYIEGSAAGFTSWNIDLGGLTNTAIVDDLHRLGVTIPSATQLALATATGDFVFVSGTTTIARMDAVGYTSGAERAVYFMASLTLTFSANILLPGNTNITTAAGDVAIFRQLNVPASPITYATWFLVDYFSSSSGRPFGHSIGCTLVGRAANSSGQIAVINIAEGEIVGRQSNVVDGYTLDDFTADDLAVGDSLIFADASESNVTNSTTVSKLLGFAASSICEGRLTLTSGTARTTADVTGATSVYFTPDIGDRITIYDGTRLKLYVFTELTLALGTLTSDLPYDVYIYDNSGTLTLESLAWTNGTTRATAIVRQNGAWYKTGALTRRYLGTFYTTATTTTEDSDGKRFLFNAHNRIPKTVAATDSSTASWTYATATWRSANADATLRVQIINGLAEYPIDLLVAGTVGGQAIIMGVGENVTNASACTGDDGLCFLCDPAGGSTILPASATLKKVPAVGFNFYQWVENAISASSGTLYNWASGGRQSGMHGTWWC